MAKVGLTKRQADAYEYIRRTLKEKRVSPTLQEIADALGYETKSAAHRLVDALVKRGYLIRFPRMSRSLALAPDRDLKAEYGEELAELRQVQSAARLYLKAKRDWDIFYQEDPHHRDNHLVYAPRVKQFYDILYALVV